MESLGNMIVIISKSHSVITFSVFIPDSNRYILVSDHGTEKAGSILQVCCGLCGADGDGD